MNLNPPPRRSRKHGRDLDEVLDPFAAEEDEGGFDVRAHLHTLWRGKWKVLLALVLGIGLAGLWLSSAVPLYTAEALVRFVTQQQSVANLDTVVSGMTSEDEALNTETMVLTSPRLLGRVVERLDLVRDPEFVNPELERDPPVASRWTDAAQAMELTPEQEIAIAVLRHKLTIEVLMNSYVLSIGVETRHPEKSAAIANTLAEAYVESQLESKFEATRRATVWLSEQVAELKTALEEAEAAAEDFAASAPLVSEEALTQSAQRLESLRDRRRERMARAESLSARVADARTLREVEDFAAAAERLDDAGLARLAQGIAEADAAVRPEAVARFDAAFDARIGTLSEQAAAMERQAATLEQATAEGSRQLDAKTGELIELRQLEREAEATRILYEHFLARMKETSVQQGVQQADAEVLSWAEPPAGPSWPNRIGTLARAMAISLALGAGLVFLLEYMNRRFRTPDELEEQTGMATMAVVPTAPGGSPLGYVIERPGSAVAEAVRNLRTSILLSNLDRVPQVVMMTSSLPGEGKSTTLLMLAQITAGMGKRTLVVESDIRRPKFRENIEGGRRRGFLSALRGQSGGAEDEQSGLLALLSGRATVEEAVQHDPASGLDIIYSQQSKANAADLFSSERFARMLGELRERYDFIFLDAPPVLLVPDSRILAQNADTVLYAVRWNTTTRDQVKSGLRLLSHAQVRVAGLILTRVDRRAIGRYGYDGYGSRYGAEGDYYAE